MGRSRETSWRQKSQQEENPHGETVPEVFSKKLVHLIVILVLVSTVISEIQQPCILCFLPGHDFVAMFKLGQGVVQLLLVVLIHELHHFSIS